MSTNQKVFEIFSTLPPNLEPATDELVKFISPHVKSKGDVKLFDWVSFKDAIDNYPGVDIVLEGYKSPDPSKHPFNELPSVCTGQLVESLNMPLPKEDLAAFLKQAFNDLSSAKEGGWASFKEISPGDPGKRPPIPAVTGWEFRKLLLAESRSRSSDFPALVVTTEFASELSKVEDWYQLDQASAKEVTLSITMMKLGVSPSFQAP
ncbi:hypothetical protein RSOLAG22IIIB_05462 [Rhizoctonia solani]|uniref:Uncharacterized protein n=1 Tax=Rhizoctonia solani TaxID=456999 RepID=A0A0K6G6H3_9AGAM|nr:hypothetical protein RSOLAG22IIIB_05462 [Rhizoctonia solani]